MTDIVNTETATVVKPLVYDKDARSVRIENADDFRVAAKFFGIPVKAAGRLPFKALAQHVLRLNWAIVPTDLFNNSVALGGTTSVPKDKSVETVWNVSYRKVHANGGTGPIQTATVTLADVRKHTGEKAGRIGPKRVMVALAAKLETTLDKLTTAGHTFANAQSEDITTAMLAGTVSEVDQTPVPVVEVKSDESADSTGCLVGAVLAEGEHATDEQITAAIAAGESETDDSETRAAVLV